MSRPMITGSKSANLDAGVSPSASPSPCRTLRARPTMAPTNEAIAQALRAQAKALDQTGSNLYRVRAFRQAAMAVLMLPTAVTEIVAQEGPAGLERIPTIGRSLAETILGIIRRLSAEAALGRSRIAAIHS